MSFRLGGVLATLINWVKSDHPSRHVIFLHGLGGDVENTWKSTGGFWPCWLGEDIAGLSVWGLGYDAAPTKWRGASMPLPDRAENVLARLLLEPSLRDGEIALIGHSLGGLVAIEVLRTAERDGGLRPAAAAFLQRVRRLVFLGTPHQGAALADSAKILGFFVRQSSSTAALGSNDPNLRSLNHWYRQYARLHSLQSLVLVETRGISPLPLLDSATFVVKPNSADPGLSELPIPVDADHISIAKPPDRAAEVYLHVREFLRASDVRPQGIVHISESSASVATPVIAIQAQIAELRDVTDKLARVERRDARPNHPGSARIIDEAVKERLTVIVRKRFFTGYDLVDETRALGNDLAHGELSGATNETRSKALAWCARFLSNRDAGKASELLQIATGLGSGDAISMGRAFLLAYVENDLDAALKLLSPFDTPLRRSAAFILRSNIDGFETANAWLKAAGFDFRDLDADAKSNVLNYLLLAGEWDAAKACADALESRDFDAAPVLANLAADVYLTQAVPVQARSLAIGQVPFEARDFPLGADPHSMESRRKAEQLYREAEQHLTRLGLDTLAKYVSRKAMWLALRDPETAEGALGELASSMQDAASALGRVPLALQFGLKVDAKAVEHEIERQVALQGGSTVETALARLALAFTQESAAAVAAYIERHRSALESELQPTGIAFVEIQMLAEAGLTMQAERRLSAVRERGIGEPELLRLQRIIAEASGADPVETRLTTYNSTGQLSDLRALVSAMKEARAWNQMVDYAQRLFDETRDSADLWDYGCALLETGETATLLRLLDEYAASVAQSDGLSELRCFALYEEGRFGEARRELSKVRGRADREALRTLEVSIAVVSGDWESLQIFVEQEWTQKEARLPAELLRAAHLAQRIGSSRAKQIVSHVAAQAARQPEVLVGCYKLATDLGFESTAEASGWLQAAAELSGRDGPVQSVSIDQIVAQQPQWDKKEAEAFEKLGAGEVPVFLVGQLLNRSQLSLSLLPALINLDEPDVRKRSVVHAFSGARQRSVPEIESVIMDVSALVSCEFLEVTQDVLAAFDPVIVSRKAMMWLFEERFKLLFHQPSRVRAAKDMQRLMAEGQIHVHSPSHPAPGALVTEVGADLADLIVAATGKGGGAGGHYVVHTFPVHKAGTLMHQEADLGNHAGVMISCSAIVDALVEHGMLVMNQIDQCRAFLSLRDRRWPQEAALTAGGHLYLDETAISTLEHLNLLPLLARAGFTVSIGRSAEQSATALIGYDGQASNAVSIIDRLRIGLRDGIESDRVKIRRSHAEKDDDVGHHPTMDLFRMATPGSGIAVDDRYINQHATVSVADLASPLVTTLDLLEVLRERGFINEAKVQDARTLLRRAQVSMVPVGESELQAYLSRAAFKDGMLVESAELRAIREHVLRLRMADALQLPKEAPWLQTLRNACLWNLKALWNTSASDGELWSKADWLLFFVGSSDWSHRMPHPEEQMADQLQRVCVLELVLLMTSESKSARQRYWKWLEDRVLVPLAAEEPDVFDAVVGYAKDLTEKVASDFKGARHEQ